MNCFVLFVFVAAILSHLHIKQTTITHTTETNTQQQQQQKTIKNNTQTTTTKTAFGKPINNKNTTDKKQTITKTSLHLHSTTYYFI